MNITWYLNFNLPEYNYLNSQEKMRATQHLSSFLETIVIMSEQGSKRFAELNTRPSKVPPAVVVLRLVQGLELEEQTVVVGLFLSKKFLQKSVHIPLKCLYKLMTVTFLLADKLCNDEHHPMESYSLLSSIPIRELIQLEALFLETLEYHLVWDEREINAFKRQDLISIKQDNIVGF